MKLLLRSAQAAVNTATTAEQDASAKPKRRPICRISSAAGKVVTAVAKTIIETGSVDQAGLLAREEPMIPPSITKMIEPVAEIS